jgi:hypothetical protein
LDEKDEMMIGGKLKRKVERRRMMKPLDLWSSVCMGLLPASVQRYDLDMGTVRVMVEMMVMMGEVLR